VEGRPHHRDQQAAGPAEPGRQRAGRRHVDALAEALKFGRSEKPSLVHRLDKDTSGVLLLARSARIARKLSEAFRARETRKIYWAAVAGVPHPRMGTIRFGLVKAPGRGRGGEGEKMLCIHPGRSTSTPDAKRATTDYAVLPSLGTRVSWVALVPVTGRTHQLRAHMAEIGHPIVGDGKYGGSGQENLGEGWGAQLGGEISRKLHLHARTIRFAHPITGPEVTITAPLPEHMARTWKTLEWREMMCPRTRSRRSDEGIAHDGLGPETVLDRGDGGARGRRLDGAGSTDGRSGRRAQGAFLPCRPRAGAGRRRGMGAAGGLSAPRRCR
jgi:23S rRNA pseudouridine955/2504/2580 synthase